MTTQDAVTELMTKAAIQYGFEIEDIRVLRGYEGLENRRDRNEPGNSCEGVRGDVEEVTNGL